MKTECDWTKKQIVMFCGTMLKRWAGVFQHVDNDIRRALVADKVLDVILGNHQDTTKEQIAALYREMCSAAGISAEF